MSILKYDSENGFSKMNNDNAKCSETFKKKLISAAIDQKSKKVFLTLQKDENYHKCSVHMVKVSFGEDGELELKGKRKCVVKNTNNLVGLEFYLPDESDCSKEANCMHCKCLKNGVLIGL